MQSSRAHPANAVLWEAVCVTLLELGVLVSKTDVCRGCVSISHNTGEGPQLDLTSSCVMDPYVCFASLSAVRSVSVAGLDYALAHVLLLDHTKWVPAQTDIMKNKV